MSSNRREKTSFLTPFLRSGSPGSSLASSKEPRWSVAVRNRCRCRDAALLGTSIVLLRATLSPAARSDTLKRRLPDRLCRDDVFIQDDYKFASCWSINVHISSKLSASAVLKLGRLLRYRSYVKQVVFIWIDNPVRACHLLCQYSVLLPKNKAAIRC